MMGWVVTAVVWGVCMAVAWKILMRLIEPWNEYEKRKWADYERTLRNNG